MSNTTNQTYYEEGTQEQIFFDAAATSHLQYLANDKNNVAINLAVREFANTIKEQYGFDFSPMVKVFNAGVDTAARK